MSLLYLSPQTDGTAKFVFFFKISEFFTSDDEANNVNLNYLGRSAEVSFIVCGDSELF